MDRVDEWRVFAMVATRRSFASAARTLGRSPQVVTRAVASLESRLGTRLLHRTTRSVSLTQDGARYLERCCALVADFDALEAAVDARTELAGGLSVGAPVLFGQLHVAPIVGDLLDAHPRVHVRLQLLDRVVSLAEEAIDVAVRIGARADSSLRARVVGYVHPVLCASPAYLERAGTPKHVDALADHDCIAFTGTTPLPDTWSFRERGKRPKIVRVRTRLTVNTGQAAIDAALAGLGVVRILSYQVGDLVAAGKLAIVLPERAPAMSPVQLVQLPIPPTRVATAFLELATERLRALLG